MTITGLNIPFADFQMAEIIDSEQFDANNKAIVDSVNSLITLINKLTDSLTVGDSGADHIASTSIIGVDGTTVQAQLNSLKMLSDSLNSFINSVDYKLTVHKSGGDHDSRYYTEAELDAGKLDTRYYTESELNNGQLDTRYYTRSQLAPYLQGGDTTIYEEVFTIVNSNNGDGTFTYSDKNNLQIIGQLDANGGQTFAFQEGTYDLGLNRVECIVGDTLRRSVRSGGLIEVNTTHVTLTVPEGAGREITFRYFERIGVSGEANLFVSNVQPPTSDANTVWMKVIN